MISVYICVVSFPGVHKCGEEEEELRKELEEWRSDLNGKVMWSVCILIIYIHMCNSQMQSLL